MRMLKGILAALFLVLVSPAHAQLFGSLFRSEVEVTLVHPPFLDLKTKRIAFAPVATPEAEELVQACVADLKASGKIEVLDRSDVEKALKEQGFSASKLADDRAVAELGQRLGSPMLFVLDVGSEKASRASRSETRTEWKDKFGDVHPTQLVFVFKTRIDYRATLQTADLASGTVYSPQQINVAPSLERIADRNKPDYPSEAEVRKLAIAQAVAQVHQVLLPRTETRTMVFYDDKDFGLREAYQRLEQKDVPGALAKSRESLAKVKADPGAKSRSVGRANYNLGVCHFILGDHAAAMPFLAAAREMDSDNKAFWQAANECEQAIKRRADMAKVDTRGASLSTPVSPASAPPTASTASPSVVSPKGTIEERLERLDALRKKGLITQEDYDRRKAEILSEL